MSTPSNASDDDGPSEWERLNSKAFQDNRVRSIMGNEIYKFIGDAQELERLKKVPITKGAEITAKGLRRYQERIIKTKMCLEDNAIALEEAAALVKRRLLQKKRLVQSNSVSKQAQLMDIEDSITRVKDMMGEVFNLEWIEPNEMQLFRIFKQGSAIIPTIQSDVFITTKQDIKDCLETPRADGTYDFTIVENKLRSHVSEIAKLNGANDNLDQRLGEALVKATSWEKQAEKTTQENVNHEMQHEEQKLQIDRLVQALAVAEQNLTESNLETTNAKQETENVKSEVHSAKEELRIAKQEFGTAQEIIGRREQALESLRAEKRLVEEYGKKDTAREESFQQLAAQLKAKSDWASQGALERIESLSRSLTEQRQDAAALEVQLQGAEERHEAEVNDIRTEYQALQKSHDAFKSQHDQEVTDLKDELIALKNWDAYTDGEIAAEERNAEALRVKQSHLDSMTEELESIRRKQADWRGDCETMARDIVDAIATNQAVLTPKTLNLLLEMKHSQLSSLQLVNTNPGEQKALIADLFVDRKQANHSPPFAKVLQLTIGTRPMLEFPDMISQLQWVEETCVPILASQRDNMEELVLLLYAYIEAPIFQHHGLVFAFACSILANLCKYFPLQHKENKTDCTAIYVKTLLAELDSHRKRDKLSRACIVRLALSLSHSDIQQEIITGAGFDAQVVRGRGLQWYDSIADMVAALYEDPVIVGDDIGYVSSSAWDSHNQTVRVCVLSNAILRETLVLVNRPQEEDSEDRHWVGSTGVFYMTNLSSDELRGKKKTTVYGLNEDEDLFHWMQSVDGSDVLAKHLGRVFRAEISGGWSKRLREKREQMHREIELRASQRGQSEDTDVGYD